MMKEFMAFLKQTNALALAIAVVIGGAVGKVVSSLAGDVLMPVISLMLPSGEWREWKVTLVHAADPKAVKTMAIGSFLGSVVDFVVISFIVYMITKALLKPEPAPAAAATKACPECLETIPKAAKRCRACGSPA